MKIFTKNCRLCGMFILMGVSNAIAQFVVIDPVVNASVLLVKQGADEAGYVANANAIRDWIVQMTTLAQMGDPALVTQMNGAGTEGFYSENVSPALIVKDANGAQKILSDAQGSNVLSNPKLDSIVGNIGQTFKLSNSIVINRKSNIYKAEAARQAQVAEYQRIKDSINDRRSYLKEELEKAMNAVENAPNDAIVQKYTAAISVLVGEIASAESEVVQAAADITGTETILSAQESAKSKAAVEKNKADLADALESEPATYRADSAGPVVWKTSDAPAK